MCCTLLHYLGFLLELGRVVPELLGLPPRELPPLDGLTLPPPLEGVTLPPDLPEFPSR